MNMPPNNFSDFFRNNKMDPMMSRAKLILVALEKQLSAVLDDRFEIKLDLFEDASIFYPAVVLSAKRKESPDTIAYHTLMVETGEALPLRSFQYQGRPIEVKALPSDVLDGVYLSRIAELMKTKYGECIPAGARLIHNNTAIDNPVIAQELAMNVVTSAVAKVIQVVYPDTELNMGQLDSDAVLTVNESYVHNARYTPQGKPVRADIRLNMATRGKQFRHNHYSPAAPAVEIGDVYGYIDIVPTSGYKYLPRFVTTAIDLRHNHTLGTQLMMIAVAAAAQKNKGWVNGLVWPNTQPVEPGATKRDLKQLDEELANANSFETAARAAEQAFADGFLFSLDIWNAGDDTWQYEVFARAANGDPDANSQIWSAANFATGGRLEQYFKSGLICYPEHSPMLFGYGIDRQGNMFDGREIDALLVKSMTYMQGPGMLNDWFSSFYSLDIPYEVREDAREKMLQSLTGNFISLDRGMRVTFTGDFLNALIMAFRDAGLMVANNRPQVIPKPAYSGPGVIDDDQSGLFRNPNYQSAPRQNNRRWD